MEDYESKVEVYKEEGVACKRSDLEVSSCGNISVKEDGGAW